MNMENPFILYILGGMKAGKSHLITWLVNEKRNDFDNVIVFTSTGFTGSYAYLKRFHFKSNIFTTFEIDKRLNYITQKQKEYVENGFRSTSRLLIILDDIMGCINVQSKALKALLSTFRHHETSIIFVSQYAMEIPRYIRSLAWYCIIFNQETEDDLEAIWKSYFRNEARTLRNFVEWFENKLNEKYTFYFVNRVLKTKFIARCPAKIF